jgi:hypothetical protein
MNRVRREPAESKKVSANKSFNYPKRTENVNNLRTNNAINKWTKELTHTFQMKTDR